METQGQGCAHSNTTAEEAPVQTYFSEAKPEVAQTQGLFWGLRSQLTAAWPEGSGCPNHLRGLDRPEAEKPQGSASPGPSGAVLVSYSSLQHSAYFCKGH